VKILSPSPSVERDALYEIHFNFLKNSFQENNFPEIIFRLPIDRFPGNSYNASYNLLVSMKKAAVVFDITP